MAINFSKIDVSKAAEENRKEEEARQFDLYALLPEGIHEIKIESMEERQTKSGKTNYSFKLLFKDEKARKWRHFFTNFYVGDEKGIGEKILTGFISRVAEYLGQDDLDSDLKVLRDQPFPAYIKHDPYEKHDGTVAQNVKVMFPSKKKLEEWQDGEVEDKPKTKAKAVTKKTSKKATPKKKSAVVELPDVDDEEEIDDDEIPF